jgi:hypothetical protein
MCLPPGLHPHHVGRPAEVLGVLRLLPPRPLAGRLARAPAIRLHAVALPSAIARVGHEELTAMQALARSPGMHRPASETRSPPSTLQRRLDPNYWSRAEEKQPTGRRHFSWEWGKKIDPRRGDFLPARNRRLPTRRSQSGDTTATARVFQERRLSAAFLPRVPPPAGEVLTGRSASGGGCRRRAQSRLGATGATCAAGSGS